MSRFKSLFHRGGESTTPATSVELPFEGGEQNEDISITIHKPKYASDEMRRMLPINPVVFFIIALIVAIIIIIITGFGAYLPFSSWFTKKKEGITLLGPNSTGKMPDALQSPSPYEDVNYNQSYGTAAGLPQYLESTNPLKYKFKEFGVYDNEGIIISEQANKIFRQLQVPLSASFHPASKGENYLTKKDPIEDLNRKVGASLELDAEKTRQLMEMEDRLSYTKHLTPEQQQLIKRIDNLVASEQASIPRKVKSSTEFAQPQRPSRLLQRQQPGRKIAPTSVKERGQFAR